MKRLRRSLITVIIPGVSAVALADAGGADLLARAISQSITLAHSDGQAERVFVRHCRVANRGCEARVDAFARYFVEAGARFNVDPWLLAAMAFRESSFNPFAKGAVGERGLLQMHPQSPWGRHLRFVKDARFRERCARQTGACQRELIHGAADLLARSLRLCDGDLTAALGSYNTGRCGGNPDYADKVLETRDELRQSVGLEPALPERGTYQPLQASVPHKSSNAAQNEDRAGI